MRILVFNSLHLILVGALLALARSSAISASRSVVSLWLEEVARIKPGVLLGALADMYCFGTVTVEPESLKEVTSGPGGP